MNEEQTEQQKKNAELVEKMHQLGDSFINEMAMQDVEAVMLPTILAIIANRAGQVLQIPSQAVLEEALKRLKAFQDLRDVNNGKLPENGTMDELIKKPKISLLEGVSSANIATPQIVSPSTGIVTAEGLETVDENTYAP
jgi:hypothetical protein